MYKKFHDDLCHFEVNYGYDVVLFIDTETSELDTEVIEFHDLSIHENNFLYNQWLGYLSRSLPLLWNAGYWYG